MLNGVGIEVIADTTAGGPPEARGADLVYQLQCRGTFAETLELDKFPIDVQELGIELGSSKHPLVAGEPGTKRRVRLNLVARAGNPPVTLRRAGVTIEGSVRSRQLSASIGTSHASESKSGNVYSVARVAIVIERLPGYFVSNVALPSFLVTTLTARSRLRCRPTRSPTG